MCARAGAKSQKKEETGEMQRKKAHIGKKLHPGRAKIVKKGREHKGKGGATREHRKARKRRKHNNVKWRGKLIYDNEVSRKKQGGKGLGKPSKEGEDK